jgi:two-component system response regulator TtrR
LPPQSTILIVDDDASTRIALERVLNHHGYVVRVFDNPARFIESIDPSYGHAHCAILDMRMQGLRGLDVQRAFSERGVQLPVIFLSGESEITEVISALKHGAADFLLKPVDTDELLNAISRALASGIADTDPKTALLKKLSRRETEILDLVAKGMRSQPIADALGIGLRTVKMHRGNLMAKLGVSNVTELLALFHN